MVEIILWLTVAALACVHPSFRDQIANTRKNRTIPNDIDYTSIIRIGENVNIFIARSAVRPALGPTAQTGSRYRW